MWIQLTSTNAVVCLICITKSEENGQNESVKGKGCMKLNLQIPKEKLTRFQVLGFEQNCTLVY